MMFETGLSLLLGTVPLLEDFSNLVQNCLVVQGRLEQSLVELVVEQSQLHDFCLVVSFYLFFSHPEFLEHLLVLHFAQFCLIDLGRVQF